MTSRRDALKSAALLPFASLPLPARAAAISGTPVAGHFTHDGARLWVQSTAEARATLRYWRAAEPESQGREVRFALSREAGLCEIVELAGLAAGTGYRYRVTLEGGAGAVGSLRTAPPPEAVPGDFRVYIGSCAYTETYTRGGNPYGANHQVFDTMASRMAGDALPHFMLWLGDNLYLRGPSTQFNAPAEYASAAHMELRYKEVRAMMQLRRLFAATHHYAIWDDHDYGPDNGDRAFALKRESLRLFEAYWPNPPRAAGASGTWRRFTHQDAEFFLLDSRYERDPEKAPPDPGKAMFGRAQMEWLREGLRESKAAFKVVAGGSQFLSEAPNGVHSGWHSYPGERDAFLAFLGRERIGGVALLSGDRHHTQLLRHAAGGFAVSEFTCSPLTSKVARLDAHDLANPRLEPGTGVEAQNFGTLEFSGRGGERRLTARCFDADGRLLWERLLATTA